jgi:hypothetical protein
MAVTFSSPQRSTLYQTCFNQLYMKKILFVLLACSLASFSFGQNKVINDPNAQQRTVTSFHALQVSHGIEVLIQQGTTEALAVSASETQYRDRIKTEVVNGVLRIYYDLELKDIISKNKKLRAYVSFKNLDNISCSSGAEVNIDGTMNASVLKVKLSSGGELIGSIKATSLDVDLSSGAQSKISGSADDLKVDASSGADFNGYDLIANKCDAEASSGAQVKIRVEKDVMAEASSGGGIDVKGNGTMSKVSTSSGGRIRKDS